MRLPSIDDKIKKLIDTHETRDPFKIAKEKNIIVLEEDLGDIYGFYNTTRRIKFLHINKNLDEKDKILTCSHELGHAICHPYENTPMLSKKNIVSELKIEKEANYFATNLIIDDTHKDFEIISKYDILKYYGLPYHFARFI